MSTPRPIQQDDVPELSDLLDDVFRRPRGITDQHIVTDFPLVFFESNHGNCRVIVEAGRIVSHAALSPRELIVGESRLKMGVIVAVATHPNYRFRGHAAALIQDLQRTMHEEHYDIGILWTGVPDFYRNLGWQTTVPRGSIALLDPSQMETLPSGDQYDVDEFVPRLHLDETIAIHEQEHVRLARSQDDYEKLFALPKIHLWIANKDFQVVAYLVHGQGINKQGIIEYGGAIDGIAAERRERPTFSVSNSPARFPTLQ